MHFALLQCLTRSLPVGLTIGLFACLLVCLFVHLRQSDEVGDTSDDFKFIAMYPEVPSLTSPPLIPCSCLYIDQCRPGLSVCSNRPLLAYFIHLHYTSNSPPSPSTDVTSCHSTHVYRLLQLVRYGGCVSCH